MSIWWYPIQPTRWLPPASPPPRRMSWKAAWCTETSGPIWCSLKALSSTSFKQLVHQETREEIQVCFQFWDVNAMLHLISNQAIWNCLPYTRWACCSMWSWLLISEILWLQCFFSLVESGTISRGLHLITSIGYISLYLRDKRYKLALTGVAVFPGSKKLYTAAKDARIFVWDLERGAKLFKITGGQKSQHSAVSTQNVPGKVQKEGLRALPRPRTPSPAWSPSATGSPRRWCKTRRSMSRWFSSWGAMFLTNRPCFRTPSPSRSWYLLLNEGSIHKLHRPGSKQEPGVCDGHINEGELC